MTKTISEFLRTDQFSRAYTIRVYNFECRLLTMHVELLENGNGIKTEAKRANRMNRNGEKWNRRGDDASERKKRVRVSASTQVTEKKMRSKKMVFDENKLI